MLNIFMPHFTDIWNIFLDILSKRFQPSHNITGLPIVQDSQDKRTGLYLGQINCR